jgi:predicted ATPase
MSNILTEELFVITGGPGAGKSALLDALVDLGYACMAEGGRTIIRDQMAIGGPALPWADAALFEELCLSWHFRSYHLAGQERGPVFFDRGVPDTVGYLNLQGKAVPAHMHAATHRFRYHSRVFVAPPWRKIYLADAERTESFPRAIKVYESVTEAYLECGYELIALPRVPIEERVRFILEVTGST